MRGVLEIACILKVVEGLRQDQVTLKVRLLGQLKELKRALDDIFELQERVVVDESEIASLRVQIDRKCAEKLELKHKVRCFEKDMERREVTLKS